MSDPRLEHARLVARAILDRLGHPAPPWTVLTITWTPSPTRVDQEGHVIRLRSVYSSEPPAVGGWSSPPQISVGLGPADGPSEETVVAYYPTHVPAAEAVAELASQIQDHASEAAWGRPLPPCPGHAHPLSAHVVDGIAVWECPTASGHYREPIAPSG